MKTNLSNIFSYKQNVLQSFKLQGLYIKPRLHSKLELNNYFDKRYQILYSNHFIIIFKIQCREVSIDLAFFIHSLVMFHSIIVHTIELLFTTTLFLFNYQYILITFGGSLENRTLIRRTTTSCLTIRRKNPSFYATLYPD